MASTSKSSSFCHVGRGIFSQVVGGLAEEWPNTRLQIEGIGGEHPVGIYVLPCFGPGVVSCRRQIVRHVPGSVFGAGDDP